MIEVGEEVEAVKKMGVVEEMDEGSGGVVVGVGVG